MDEVLPGKAAIIERCLKRIEQEYRGHEGEFESNHTRQDSILLNLQRACEAAMHLVRIHRLGIPGESKQAFMLLTHAGQLDPNLAAHLAAMVGFRNIAVHNYREARFGGTERTSEKAPSGAATRHSGAAQRNPESSDNTIFHRRGLDSHLRGNDGHNSKRLS